MIFYWGPGFKISPGANSGFDMDITSGGVSLAATVVNQLLKAAAGANTLTTKAQSHKDAQRTDES